MSYELTDLPPKCKACGAIGFTDEYKQWSSTDPDAVLVTLLVCECGHEWVVD